MPGVDIGDGAIILPNSVVTKSVLPYTIVVGNPAKHIRDRFSKEESKFLLELRWWNWSIEKITQNLHLIAGGNLETGARTSIREFKKLRCNSV